MCLSSIIPSGFATRNPWLECINCPIEFHHSVTLVDPHKLVGQPWMCKWSEIRLVPNISGGFLSQHFCMISNIAREFLYKWLFYTSNQKAFERIIFFPWFFVIKSAILFVFVYGNRKIYNWWRTWEWMLIDFQLLGLEFSLVSLLLNHIYAHLALMQQANKVFNH